MTPCIIITRDRLSYTQLCIRSLEQYPELDIHLVDHGSTWGPMLDYLEASSYPVHRLDDRPPRALWTWPGLVKIVDNQRYVVTDPDVVLDCPSDWLDELNQELDHGSVKVGLGLRLDDLPPTPLAAKVCSWECEFWCEKTTSGRAWLAPVDTTLALYPPLFVQSEFELAPAARLDVPYLIRHLPWYGDLDPVETDHYRQRVVSGSSHWVNEG